MIRITSFIKPHRLEPVKTAVAALGVSGMSVSDVRGKGNSPEPTDLLVGNVLLALPIRTKVEVVVPDDLSEKVVEAIMEAAQTGESGDGKIFLEKVADVVRVRTNERGDVGL